MSFLSTFFSLRVAAVFCGLLSLAAVALAFPGAERAASFMSHPVIIGAVAAIAAAMLFCGGRSWRRRQSAAAIMHLGCALILSGWCAGRIAERTASPERPFSGSMALVDGEKSDLLWKGEMLDIPAGRIPFSVELEKFFVKRYGDADSPVKEYRSHVTIGEEGKAPYPLDIRVNHPGRVCGYWIYQMSWGEARDRAGNPVRYTVLQFNRDPGVLWVFLGFAVLFLGTLLFAARLLGSPKIPPTPAEGSRVSG
ncbi:MAG: cytochrome c biogenesis protein ResB [Kiritimatiellae bacterium]|nr:cytochrome c biogenesis protein ResB [Kiritimatiellia bacterium]